MEIQIILPEKCLERPASPLTGRSAELLSFWGLFSGRSSVGGLPRQQCKWNHQPWNPVKHDSWRGRWCISSNNEMCQRYNKEWMLGGSCLKEHTSIREECPGSLPKDNACTCSRVMCYMQGKKLFYLCVIFLENSLVLFQQEQPTRRGNWRIGP